jgi:hypothetical protein
VSEELNESAPMRRFGLTPFQWRITIPLGLIAIIFMIFPKSPPFVNPHIHAAPYVWPAGCEAKKYRELDDISEACQDSAYNIGNGLEYGWPQTSKRAEYYRIGNDSVHIVCLPWKNRCSVTRIINDVFESGIK